MILLNIEDLTFEKNNVRYTYNIKNFNHEWRNNTVIVKTNKLTHINKNYRNTPSYFPKAKFEMKK